MGSALYGLTSSHYSRRGGDSRRLSSRGVYWAVASSTSADSRAGLVPNGPSVVRVVALGVLVSSDVQSGGTREVMSRGSVCCRGEPGRFCNKCGLPLPAPSRAIIVLRKVQVSQEIHM